MYLLNIIFLSLALWLTPITAHGSDTAFFPDLKTAKEAYKAKNYAKAANHWMPLAHKGNADAQVELGKLYSKGLGVVQNDKTALNLFLASAKQNNARALFEVGRAYEGGKGVPKDIQQAKEWYRLAADAGYARGHYAIGELYEKNKLNSDPIITPETKDIIQTSVNRIKDGDYSVAEYLGDLYQSNIWVPKNDQRALTYYFLAEKNGSDSIQRKVNLVKTKVSLKNHMWAERHANILLAKDNKEVRDERRELIRSLKNVKRPEPSIEEVKQYKQNSLRHYERAAQDGYQRAETKVAEITNTEAPIQDNNKKSRRKFKATADIKSRFVGEENLDLGTRSDDFETAAVLDGKLGLYLYPTENITTFIEGRGLLSDGSASSNSVDDDDSMDLSFAEMRQAWIQFERLFGTPTSIKAGRQRFYEQRGLWWNRDLDAIKLSFNTTMTKGFMAVGENQDNYRIGDDNDFDRDEEDRLRVLGELSHEHTQNHFLEARFLYEDDHSGTGTIGQLVPSDDRDRQDFELIWAGVRAKGRAQPTGLAQFGYRADLMGVAGEETNISTNAGPSAGFRSISTINDRDVLGWAFDGSIDVLFNTILDPTLTLGYAFGSGDDGRGDNNAFRQTGLEGNTSNFPEGRTTGSIRNYGEVLRPELSNIHIASAGLNFPLFNASDVNLNYFSYWLDDNTTGLLSSDISAPLNGQDTYVGQALDFMANINIGEELQVTSPVFKNTALRLRAGSFQAGDAYGVEDGEYAYRGSTELRVKF